MRRSFFIIPILVTVLALGACQRQRDPVPSEPADDDSGEDPGNWLQVATGRYHNCAVRADHTVACWGDGTPSGDGANEPPDGSFDKVGAGARHSCGLHTDGTIECWGCQSVGGTEPCDAPEGAFIDLAVGWYHNCATTADHRVQCWGSPPAAWGYYDVPDRTFKTISVGEESSCGIDFNERVWCWGNGPVELHQEPSFPLEAVAVGHGHACAITSTGGLYCWGHDANGDESHLQPPTESFDLVSSGSPFSCGVRRADGSIVCWGTRIEWDSAEPAGVAFRQIQSNYCHTCGVTTEGELSCFGCDHAHEGSVPDSLR